MNLQNGKVDKLVKYDNKAYYFNEKEAEKFKDFLKEKLNIESEVFSIYFENRKYYVVGYKYNKSEV